MTSPNKRPSGSDACVGHAPAESFEEVELVTDDDLRGARIEEYRRESLEKSAHLEACLGAHAAGLMRIGWRHEQALLAALEAKELTPERMMELRSALNTNINLAREIGRFTDFQLRLQLAGENAAASKYGRRPFFNHSARRRHHAR